MPFISIIVPVYLVEQYLAECINSILSQSFQDYELLLIDDGSSDNSAQICEDFATKNSRIRVIHKEHSGLSSTRNMGLDVANGEYILFLDSDDIISEDSLQKIADKLESRPDVLISSIFNTKDVNKIDYSNWAINYPVSKDKTSAINYVFFQNPTPWPAVQYPIKKSLIDKYNLRFDVGFYHEDVVWTCRALSSAQTFEYFDDIWYIRRQGREGSITSTIMSKRTTDILTLVRNEMVSDRYDKLDVELKNAIFNLCMRAVFASFANYYKYSKSDQKIISAFIKENFFMFQYTSLLIHKIFVLMMRCLGISFSLNIYGRLIKFVKK